MNKLIQGLKISILLSLILSVGLASAQTSKGSISGTVLDQTGAAVVGAKIKVTQTSTNQSFTTTSDSVGFFRLNLLPVGSYTVSVTKEGFQGASYSNIGVAVAADSSVGEIKLQVGTAGVTVEVSGAAPIIESTQAQITNNFTTQDLTNLPGVQENEGLDTLAVLLPGVSNVRDMGFSNTNGMGFSVNGLRGRNNDQEVDGQNNNDNSVAGPAVFLSNPEFVSQYQLITNNFGPEYGRNAGSVVNIITKSGTNNWHGAGYVTEGNSALNSLSNIQAQPAPSAACPTCFGEGLTKPPHFNDLFWTGTIGGPVIKNKVFVFGGVDSEIDHSTFLYANSDETPTPTGLTQLAGCYTSSQSQAAISALKNYGPYGIAGGNLTTIPGNQLQLNGIDPATGAAFAGFVPNGVDSMGNPDCNVDAGGVQRTLPNGSHEWDWISRVDIVASQKDTIYARYLYQKLNFFDQDSFASGNAALGYPNDVPSLGQQFGLDWTHQISNRMVNEFRLTYGRTNVEFGGNSLGNTVPNDQQIGNAVAEIKFSAGGLAGYGAINNSPQGRIVNTYQLQDNWNYVVGKHQFKGGINYTYQRSPNYFLPNLNGTYTFTDWNSYAGNEPSAISIAQGTDVLDFREHDTFVYFGDDYKVAHNLTLNLGLTYTYYGQPANLFHTNDLRQQTGSNPFWDPSLPQSVTVFPTIPAPKNSWGPGVGFAWSPDFLGNGKTVIRGGYRLAYDPPFYNIYLNISSAAPQVLSQTLTACAAAPCSASTAGGNPLPAVPTGPTVRSSLASNLTFGVSDPRSFSNTTVAPNFGPDRVHEWSFGIERALGAHAAAEVRYVGNHGENLFESLDGNPDISGYPTNALPSGVTPCTNPPPGAPALAGHVDCNGFVRERVRNNGGYSYYNGLQTELRTNNLWNQLTAKATYTFSKTTDNVSEIFSTFGAGNSISFAQDPFNPGAGEYGISGLNFPHTVTLSLYEMVPFMRSQQGLLGHVLGGWGIGATYIWQSGQPYTPTQYFFGTFSGGCCNDTSFNNAFIGTYDNVRPFYGNRSAPANTVGAYAGDVCNFQGDPVSCGMAPTQLVDWAAVNSTGAVNPVSKDQVRYILNGPTADAVFGTPWGNVGRNQVQDAITNTTNLEISKTVKAGERVNITWHMSLINAFNHPNYGYLGTGTTTGSGIDPFVDADAGLTGIGTGFANPQVFDGGHRIIRFGLRVGF